MLTIQESLEAIIQGVHEANNEYLKMSGGWCVQDSGVESLISSSIARSLFIYGQNKDNGCFVTLETDYRLLRQARPGRIPRLLRNGQRADVVYWHKKDYPIGVIEVKRHFQFSAFMDDISRTRRLLLDYGSRAGGTLRWGALGSLRAWWATRYKSEKDVLAQFVKSCEERFPDIIFTGAWKQEPIGTNEHTDEGFLGYRAFAVLMRPRPS